MKSIRYFLLPKISNLICQAALFAYRCYGNRDDRHGQNTERLTVLLLTFLWLFVLFASFRFFFFLFSFSFLLSSFFLQKKLFPHCFRSHAQLCLFCIRRHIYWFCEYCKVSLVVFWISMLCFPVAEWILRVLVKLYAWRNSFSFKCRYLSISVPISRFVFVGWESVLTSGSSNPRRRTRNPFLTLFVLHQGKVAIIGANVQAS